MAKTFRDLRLTLTKNARIFVVTATRLTPAIAPPGSAEILSRTRSWVSPSSADVPSNRLGQTRRTLFARSAPAWLHSALLHGRAQLDRRPTRGSD